MGAHLQCVVVFWDMDGSSTDSCSRQNRNCPGRNENGNVKPEGGCKMYEGQPVEKIMWSVKTESE